MKTTVLHPRLHMRKFRNGLAVLLLPLLTYPCDVAAQQPAKVPDSVAALAKKYDETRKKTLGPILDALATELKLNAVPAITRAGKPDIAIQLAEAAGKLTGSVSPVMPGVGAPFTAEALAAVKETVEWKAFVDKFSKAETALNESYRKALDREKATFQANGDPYGVVAIDNEVKRVEGLAAGISPPMVVAQVPPATPTANQPSGMKSTSETTLPKAPQPTSSKPAKEQVKELEARFVGKMFGFDYEKNSERIDFYFRKNGEAVRRITPANGKVSLWPGTWKIGDDMSVEVSGIASPKWFWFDVEGNCTWRQGTKEGRQDKLERVPDAKDPGK